MVYTKCVLIKVALEVSIDDIIFPTNFAMPIFLTD